MQTGSLLLSIFNIYKVIISDRARQDACSYYPFCFSCRPKDASSDAELNIFLPAGSAVMNNPFLNKTFQTLLLAFLS